jgi:hypothetical protein
MISLRILNKTFSYFFPLASRDCDAAGDWLAVPFGLLVLLVDAEELLAAGVVIVFRLLPGANPRTSEFIATTPGL